jgi:VCBS repeat-containing protein
LALTGTTDGNALAAGDHIHDSFVYAIRLGNGTLSWATTTVDVYGQNDAASISGVAAGTLTEDDTNPVTGTLTVTDADRGESHTQTATNTTSIGGLGTYSVDAGGHWSYTVNNALVQYLHANQSTTDSFVVTSLDGTAYQTVTVTITGSADEGLSFSRADYAAGTGPEVFAIADLNGDGKLDLVVPDTYGGTVSVLLGNGDGSYGAPTAYPVYGAHKVAIGDLNGDGKLDIVSNLDNGGSADGALAVLLGNGDGTFQAQPTTYAVTGNAAGVTLADLNGDGKLDAVIPNQYGTVIDVLIGNCDGTFEPATTYEAGNGPGAVTIADLNGDGKLDLVVQDNGSNSLAVLLGNGDGTFQAPMIYAGVSGYAISDLNGDGKLDVGGSTADGFEVLLGNGDGSFQAPTIYTTVSGGGIAFGDLNGDGIIDIAHANYQNNSLSVWLGNGDGTFQPDSSYATGNNPFAVAMADLNGDGMLDIAVTNVEGATISILLNTSDFFSI